MKIWVLKLSGWICQLQYYTGHHLVTGSGRINLAGQTTFNSSNNTDIARNIQS